jgi:hypothetical protein
MYKGLGFRPAISRLQRGMGKLQIVYGFSAAAIA